MRKHLFLTLDVPASGFHFGRFEHAVQGKFKTLSVRASADSDNGTLTNIWFIHNPDRHRPRDEEPPEDLLVVHVQNVTMVPSETEASIKSPVDEEPDFSGGLGVVVQATVSSASELTIVVGIEI